MNASEVVSWLLGLTGLVLLVVGLVSYLRLRGRICVRVMPQWYLVVALVGLVSSVLAWT